VEELRQHRDMIYMETTHGSHIGFIEGGLLEAFSSDRCYTYPAKIALAFFNLAAERMKSDEA
jgi:predicted alpha/beta-fold hydrolase